MYYGKGDLQMVDGPSFSIARCDVWNIIHHFHGQLPTQGPTMSLSILLPSVATSETQH